MTVENQFPYQSFTANGLQASYALGFYVYDKDHIEVKKNDQIVHKTDYSYEKNSNSILFNTTPNEGDVIEVQRVTTADRATTYATYNNTFRPEVLNKDIDRIWLKLQELGVVDWILDNKISDLKDYVDIQDNELKNTLLAEIQAQGISIDQLETYYNYLMLRLAQIAVDKGWDASFIVDGEYTQKQINEKTIQIVESILDLISIKNPKDGQSVYVKSYHAGLGLGGGTFTYDRNKSKVNNGITIFNGWVRTWDELNVKPEWAGAKADGITDDSGAIQHALDFISSTIWDTSVAVMNQKGGGVNLVLSAKKYRITQTIWVGAYTTIRGTGMLGFNSNSVQVNASVIYADLQDVNTAAISSSNWNTGGVRVPFNAISSGSDYDNSLVSATHGLKLYDFSIVASKKTHMGLRIQNSPQSRIEVYTHGFDYGVMLNASWQSYVNCRTLSYKCGLLLLSDNNGVKFDGYYNALEGDPLNYQNFLNFFSSDTDTDTTWNDSNVKFGVVSRYSFGLCSDSIVAEHNSIGIVIASGDVSIQTLYTEVNTIVGLGCYTSTITINDWVGYGDTYDMLIGANGKLYVNGITKDNVITGIKKFSQWNSVLSTPMTYNYYVRGIKYHNTDNVIYVSATGSDSNNGVYQPLLTLDEAINRIKNTYDQRDKTITVPNKEAWTIKIQAEGIYPIIKRHLIACDVEIRSTLVNKPTITVEGGDNNAIVLAGSNFTLTGCNLTKGVTTGLIENAIFWSTTGENTITIESGTLTINGGAFVYPSWNGGSFLNVSLYGVTTIGSSSSMLVSSNYLNGSPHSVSFLNSQGTIDTNILSRTDKGIAVPDTWKSKVLGV